jgi:hypothetical protein
MEDCAVTRTLCGFMLLFAIACSDSQSPTAPTSPTTPPTAAGPTVITLDWGVSAASCGSIAPPPSAPPAASANIVSQTDNSITASWPYQSGTRTLYARFVLESGRWALCSWDVADV